MKWHKKNQSFIKRQQKALPVSWVWIYEKALLGVIHSNSTTTCKQFPWEIWLNSKRLNCVYKVDIWEQGGLLSHLKWSFTGSINHNECESPWELIFFSKSILLMWVHWWLTALLWEWMGSWGPATAHGKPLLGPQSRSLVWCNVNNDPPPGFQFCGSS